MGEYGEFENDDKNERTWKNDEEIIEIEEKVENNCWMNNNPLQEYDHYVQEFPCFLTYLLTRPI